MSLESDLLFLLDTKPDTTWGLLGTWDGGGGLSLQETSESNVQPTVCFLWVTSPKSARYLKISKSYGMKFIHYLQSLPVEGEV